MPIAEVKTDITCATVLIGDNSSWPTRRNTCHAGPGRLGTFQSVWSKIDACLRHDSRMPAHVMAFRAALSPIRLVTQSLRSFFKEFKVEIELLKVRFANGSTQRSFHLAIVVIEVLMRR